MLRGRISFDEQRFAKGATKLDQLSRQPWQHFPQVTDDHEDSAARDEVWQRQERFQQLVRELEASTGQLASAAQTRPFTAQGMAPLVQKVEDGCEACHKEFRAY
ncbi:Cytochrome C' [compost metagenome]